MDIGPVRVKRVHLFKGDLIIAKMAVSHFKKNAFKLILCLQIVYLTASVFVPGLPGWKMFSALNLTSFKITDVEKNEIIDPKKYMVSVFYTISDDSIIDLAQFICQKENKTIRIELDSKPPIVKVFNKDGCGN